MKRFLLFVILTALVALPAIGEDINKIKAESSIAAVTVYADRALVTRTASLDLPAGATEITFDGLPLGIDENSLRAKGAGVSGAKILGIDSATYFVEKPIDQKARELQDQVQKLRDDDRICTDQLATLQAEKEFLQSLKNQYTSQLTQELVVNKTSIAEYKDMNAFLKESVEENAKKTREINITRRDLDLKIKALLGELNKIQSQPRYEYRKASVTVELKTAGKLDVDLLYMAYNASWRPTYDVRVNSDKGAVEMTYNGFVAQRTGENWDNVNLTLSTAKPSIGARIPELHAWNLDLPKPTDESLGNRQYNEGQMTGGWDGGRAGEPMPSNAILQTAQAIAVEKLTSVFFNIIKKENIPSDGSLHKTTISTLNFKADLAYEAVPKLSPFAYLKATITNDSSFPLIAGPTNIFLGPDFVGTASINTIAPTEKFDCSLGIDESIKIERKQEKKFDEAAGGFLSSSKKRKSFGYKITASNYKKTNVTVTVTDQLPVPQNENITYEMVSCTPNFTEKTKDNLMKWKLELKPQEKKEITFEFYVDAPADAVVTGLD